MKIAKAGAAAHPQHRRLSFAGAKSCLLFVLHEAGRNKAIRSLLVALFLTATAAGLASADPGNRTVTTTTWSWRRCNYQANLVSPYSGSCTLTLYGSSCPNASTLGGYFNPAATSCGSTWPGTCGSTVTCNIVQTGSATVSCSPDGNPECTSSTSTTTYPPATISVGAASCSQPGSEGWCLSGLSLPLTGNEPWTAYRITSIESDAFGTICTGSAATLNCSLDVPEGNHTARFRSVSSFGDSSYWSSQTSLRVDGTPPSANLSVPPTDGLNGWHVSPVTAAASGSDATSGVASASINASPPLSAGGGDSSLSIATDGVYDLTAVVCDAAGNCAAASTTVRLDTTSPELDLTAPTGFCPACGEALAIQYSIQDAPSGIASWTLLAGGTTLTGGTESAGGTLAWDGTGLGPGSHALVLQAADRAGNLAELVFPVDLQAAPAPDERPAPAPQEQGYDLPLPNLDPFPMIEIEPESVKPAPEPIGEPAVDSEDAPDLILEDASPDEQPAAAAAFPDILIGAAAVAAATAALAYGSRREEELLEEETLVVGVTDKDGEEKSPSKDLTNPVWVQSPYIEYVERVDYSVKIPTQKWVAPYMKYIPPTIKTVKNEYTAYRPKSRLVQKIVNVVTEVLKPVKTLVKRVSTWVETTWLGKLVKKVKTVFEPVTTWVKQKVVQPVMQWVQETFMEPYPVTEYIQVPVPASREYIPGHYETVWEPRRWTAEETRYRSVCVEAGDLPAWVAQRFFTMLDPHMPLEAQKALFYRFRDGLGINPRANVTAAYEEALDVFFKGTPGEGEPTNAASLLGEYGSKGAFDETADGRKSQFLNLEDVFEEGKGYPTVHYALCGELSVMAALGLDIQSGLETFNSLQGLSVPVWDSNDNHVKVNGVPQYTTGTGADILTHERCPTLGSNLTAFLKAGGVGDCTWGGNFMQPADLAKRIDNGEHLIALVNMDNTDGKLRSVESSASDVSHWVTILGVLPTGGGEPVVRVYNPYRNTEELYSWSTFKGAWAETPGNSTRYGLITAAG